MSNLPSPSTSAFRDLGDSISPSWLLGPVGSRYRYSMSVMYDTLADGMGYAIRAGLPEYAPPDALPYFAQDRLIIQGPSEPAASYIQRLVQWLDLWRHAGSSMSIMLAALGYVSPATPEVLMVQSAKDGSVTSWQTYQAGVEPFPRGQTNPTPPATQTIAPANWAWDGLSQPYYAPWMRWRSWLVIFSLSGTPWPAPTKTWATGGSFTLSVVSDPVYGTKYVNGGTPGSAGANTFSWGDGTCWGWGGTVAQAAGLTAIARQWKSGGTWIPWIIVSYDATMFDQSQAFGSSKLPDGHWGYWGKVVSDATWGSVYVPARPAATTCSFVVGTNDGPAGAVLGIG